jgi:NAD+ synthase
MRPTAGANPFSAGDPEETINRIVRFLRTHSERIGVRNLVVGMSGGLDSSVTAVLCSKALGGKRTLGYFLPEGETWNPRSLKDAEEVAREFGISFKSLDITGLVQTASSLLHPSRKKETVIPFGNLKARLRATILYYYANTSRGLVVGTGDKSEIMLGYFTKYGDGACDIQPIADIYKSTVRDLARHLRLPRRI